MVIDFARTKEPAEAQIAVLERLIAQIKANSVRVESVTYQHID